MNNEKELTGSRKESVSSLLDQLFPEYKRERPKNCVAAQSGANRAKT